MRHAFPLVLLVLLGAASPAAAQGCFFDPDPDASTGAATNVIPFGNGTASWDNQRCQNLILKHALPGTPGLLTAVGFAPSASSTGALYSSMELRIGHNNTGALQAPFAGNYMIPETVCFQQANFSWVYQASEWAKIPLTVPFIYNGTDNLIVDVIALGSALNSKSGFRRSSTIPRNYSTSYSAAVTSGTVSITGQKTALYFGSACALPYGKGCPCSALSVPSVVAETAPALASLFRVAVKGGPGMAPALLNVGASRTQWGPFALPFDLAGIGAPGCALNASPVLFFARPTDPVGYSMIPLAIPGDPALDGATLYLQWILVDPGANPGGLAVTPGLSATIGR